MTTTTDLEAAMDAARKAGDSPIDGFVERLAERIGAKVNVSTVFGEPIERDGITVIPVAKVRWGFGGGAGGPIGVGPAELDEGGDAATDQATAPGWGARGSAGQGGGGGATADPVGWLEIGPEGAEFKPVTPAMPSPGFLLAAGAAAALVLRGLTKLIRR